MEFASKDTSLIMEKLNELSELPKLLESFREELRQETRDIKDSLDYSYKEIEEWKSKSEKNKSEIMLLQTELHKERTANIKLRSELTTLGKKVNQQENYSRRYNLLFDGVKEEQNEDCKQTIMNILREKLQLAMDWTVDVAHRNGKPFQGKNRKIIVKFRFLEHRQLVWANRRKLKDTSLFMSEDFCEETKSARSRLTPIMKAAWKHQHNAKLVKDELIIDGVHYTLSTLHRLPQHLDPAKVATPTVQENTIAFYGQFSPLSNFHLARFTVDGQEFASSEHYFQHAKALHSDQDDIASSIMNAPDPAVAKRLGNQVKPNNSWNQRMSQVMKTGCIAKFEQNEHIKEFLLSTGNKYLVHAGPDRTWAASVRLESPNLMDKSWPGQNKLGELLMSLRETIKG